MLHIPSLEYMEADMMDATESLLLAVEKGLSAIVVNHSRRIRDCLSDLFINRCSLGHQ